MNLLVKRSKRTKLLVPIIRLEILESDVIGRVAPPPAPNSIWTPPLERIIRWRLCIRLSNLPPWWLGNWTDEVSRPSCILNLAPVLRRRREAGAFVCVMVDGRIGGKANGQRRGTNLERSRCFKGSVRCRMQPPLMWSRQPLWHATHVDLVIPDRKPPCSCWRESCRAFTTWHIHHTHHTLNIITQSLQRRAIFHSSK